MRNNKCIPIAVYRLQLSANLNFKEARNLIDYLKNLGITHFYLSPIFGARKGSSHGYDIVNHGMLNPEIGTEEEFQEMVDSLRAANMGVILDIVPNHMFVDASNQWWYNVLENGPSSPYADYFDIDWEPSHGKFSQKVLLPILGESYKDSLEQQQIQITYQEGALFVTNKERSFPTDLKTWNLILNPMLAEIRSAALKEEPYSTELESIASALHYLPSFTDVNRERVRERQREKEHIKRRLKLLVESAPEIKSLLEKQLLKINGQKGEPHSFDELESFLNKQPYRLSHWHVANDEINYRRFFDVFEFAGIWTEKPEVFDAIHHLVFKMIKSNQIDGLRVDHVDGLWDPEKYLDHLHTRYLHLFEEKDEETNFSERGFFTVVEKILMDNETLRADWKIDGTVGYDFLNQANQLFVFQPNKKTFYKIYQKFTGLAPKVPDLVFNCKQLMLDMSFASEINSLTVHLMRIAQQQRSSRDFTYNRLRLALKDIISSFLIYRTYVRAEIDKVHPEDSYYITNAVFTAKQRNPNLDLAIFDFIQDILLLNCPVGLTEEQVKKRKNFVMRFQQITGPAMAKGLEDTALYRFYPLASINEVGAELTSFGSPVDGFHSKNQMRAKNWPHTLVVTSTHDTKRSADVRSRINVLSELPTEWKAAINLWTSLNKIYKTRNGNGLIPDKNEEYLIYQTLIGTWPLMPMNDEERKAYTKRIQTYMEKAITEAKVNTSWINPNRLHIKGLKIFIEKILDPALGHNKFLDSLQAFMPKIIPAGMLNSLSQVILKATSPGVPDTYQGNELWDFSLVDPDNRRPVDFNLNKKLFEEVKAKSLRELLEQPGNGMIKLFVTYHSLQVRQRHVGLFLRGGYLPLTAEGERENHLITYARVLDDDAVVVITTRFLLLYLKTTS